MTKSVPSLVGGIIGANGLTMSLMNFMELTTAYTSLVYLFCCGAITFLIWTRGPRFPALEIQAHVAAIALGLVLFAPRAAYLFEPVLGYSVTPLGDDPLHLQEMSSIVHSEKFPPTLTYNSHLYLSYYYAPYMFGAALYATGLLLTVKQALACTVLTYSIIACYTVFYAARILFTDLRSQRLFILLAVFYAGFEFLYWACGGSWSMNSPEWWVRDFGLNLQFSSFVILVLFVQQHLISALAVLYGLHILHCSTALAARVLAGVMFFSALYSSTFVVLGAVPLCIWFFFRFRAFRAIPAIICVVVLLSLPLFWMFIGRSAPVGFALFGALSEFWLEHKRAAVWVFLAVLSLNFLPLIWSGFRSMALTASGGSLFALNMGFLLSTLLVSYYGYNNYAMRGAIIPIFCLEFMSVPVLCRWVYQDRSAYLAALLFAYLLGGILDYVAFIRTSVAGVWRSRSAFSEQALEFNEGTGQVKATDLEKESTNEDDWYVVERPRLGGVRLLDLERESTVADNGYRITAFSLTHWRSHAKQ